MAGGSVVDSEQSVYHCRWDSPLCRILLNALSSSSVPTNLRSGSFIIPSRITFYILGFQDFALFQHPGLCISALPVQNLVFFPSPPWPSALSERKVWVLTYIIPWATEGVEYEPSLISVWHRQSVKTRCDQTVIPRHDHCMKARTTSQSTVPSDLWRTRTNLELA